MSSNLTLTARFSNRLEYGRTSRGRIAQDTFASGRRRWTKFFSCEMHETRRGLPRTGSGSAASCYDVLELHSFERVERFQLCRGQHRGKNIRAGWRNGSPPGCHESLDFFIDELNRDAAALGESCHACDRSIQVAEVCFPIGGRRQCEREERFPRFFAECDAVPGSAGILLELELQIRFDVLRTFFQTRQAKCPKVDSSQQIFTKSPFVNGLI